jgi:hypothetical protein
MGKWFTAPGAEAEPPKKRADMTGELRVSFEDYLADCAPEASLSRSTIMDLLYKSPRHAWFNHPRLNPDYEQEDSEEKFDIGTAAHSLFLQGIDRAEIVEAKDWRTKEAKEKRDAARASGLIPLLSHQYDDVVSMVNAAQLSLHKSEISLSILGDGDSELTYIWQEGETWFRIRPDWISSDRKTILDYKTTGKLANPEDFVRSVTAYGYDVQEALYKRGVSKVCGTRPNFTFMVQETYPPYLCSFIELDLQFQDMGESKVRTGTKIWRECMASGKWPGYPSTIYTLEPPAWALASWEMRKGAYDVHI